MYIFRPNLSSESWVGPKQALWVVLIPTNVWEELHWSVLEMLFVDKTEAELFGSLSFWHFFAVFIGQKYLYGFYIFW